jgi:hypothetical protein
MVDWRQKFRRDRHGLLIERDQTSPKRDVSTYFRICDATRNPDQERESERSEETIRGDRDDQSVREL